VIDTLAVHGFADMAWDDARLPESFWKNLVELPSGCWVPKARHHNAFRETMVTRLLRVPWQDVFSAVPTCGNVECCNPRHVCVVLGTVLSKRRYA
jgi:hypothetical protein